MESNKKCIFCNNELLSLSEYSETEIYCCTCPNCGEYQIDSEALEDLPYYLHRNYKFQKHNISGYLREMSDKGLQVNTIRLENFDSFWNSINEPKSLTEKLDKLLIWFFINTEFFYQAVEIHFNQPAIGYAKNDNEIQTMVMALRELGYVVIVKDQLTDKAECRVTVEGVKRAESLQKKTSDSKRVFVAMWFTDEMRDIFDKYISNAIKDTGYDPFIIDMKEHNDDICDQIIAEIRQSKFLVADFTGDRGGIYFETGFAYGLDKTVVWCCRKDWLDKIHFDINHYNFIVWENGQELYERLKARILATLPL